MDLIQAGDLVPTNENIDLFTQEDIYSLFEGKLFEIESALECEVLRELVIEGLKTRRTMKE